MYELILHGIFKSRSNHRFITRALRVAGHDEEYTDDQCQTIIEKLSLIASLSNPMATTSLDQFGDFRDRFLALQHKLTLKVANIKRRLKLFSFSKRVGGYTLLDLAVHKKAGGRSTDQDAFPRCRAAGAETKRSRSTTERKPRGSKLERLYVQLDPAKKGTYILLNEFATLQMLANSIDGEVEHRKLVAYLCVGNRENRAVSRQVLRELSMDEKEFLEQLDELEDHVYLCFSTVTRSRKLVIDEIMASQ